jgi:hypothetical protein
MNQILFGKPLVYHFLWEPKTKTRTCKASFNLQSFNQQKIIISRFCSKFFSYVRYCNSTRYCRYIMYTLHVRRVPGTYQGTVPSLGRWYQSSRWYSCNHDSFLHLLHSVNHFVAKTIIFSGLANHISPKKSFLVA